MKPLVLIHGMLMSGWIFHRLDNYFSKYGYQCHKFNYSSRRESITEIGDRLNNWIINRHIINPDFICHSMGGLICHQYFKQWVNATDGENSTVVCLGSPFGGSMVAQSLSRSIAGRYLLGVQTDAQLTTGVKFWPSKATLGIIAGNKSLGAGLVLGLDRTQPGDGTILVSETNICGATDQIVLPVSHSEMTFSQDVFTQTRHFLENQTFNHKN